MKNVDEIAQVLADVPSFLAQISAEKDGCDAALSLPGRYQRLAAAIEEIAEAWILTGQWGQAINLLRPAIELADKAEDEGKCGARLRILLGDLLWRRGDHTEALVVLQEAKRLAEQALDDKTLGDALYYLGDLYYIEAFYMNKRDRAEPLEYHERALALRRKVSDRPGITHSLSRLGTMYEQMGEPERALEMHDEAIRIATEIGYDPGLDRPITHRAAYHYRRGEFEEALAYFWQALEVIRRTGDQASLVFGLGSVADTLCKVDEGHLDVALQLCARALAIAEELDFKLGLCRTLLLAGELHLGCGEQGQAWARFREAAALAARVGYERFRAAAEEMEESIR